MMPDYRQDNPYQNLLAQSLEAQGCRVEFPSGFRRVLPLYRALKDCPAAQVLHLHWLSPYLHGNNRFSFLVCAIKFLSDLTLVRLSGWRIVWTMHNVLPHETRFPRLETFVRRRVCRLASAVIVHGEAGRQEAIKHFGCPAEKLVVIPHGHYRAAYSPAPATNAARSSLDLPMDKRTVLFLGMVRPYKGLDSLLEAWRKLSPLNAQLLIAGGVSGPYRQHIEDLISQTSDVIWHNRWIPTDEIPTYFGAADVVALPFEQIQTSGSVMLSMSYGKPVIAPRLGDLPETLAGADDLMYPAGDRNALAERLNYALSADLTDLAARTATAADQFDWEPIGKQTAAVYFRTVAVCGLHRTPK
jgi:glycosyltransferase involved in cell wall biosynthesis